jgi:hypothetical protein
MGGTLLVAFRVHFFSVFVVRIGVPLLFLFASLLYGMHTSYPQSSIVTRRHIIQLDMSIQGPGQVWTSKIHSFTAIDGDRRTTSRIFQKINQHNETQQAHTHA